MFFLARAIYNYVIDDSKGRLLGDYNPVELFCNTNDHRLNMELDLQILFGFHVHSCNHWLRPLTPIPPQLGSYTRALLVSQDRLHLFITPS
jgi:hypothetical protein